MPLDSLPLTGQLRRRADRFLLLVLTAFWGITLIQGWLAGELASAVTGGAILLAMPALLVWHEPGALVTRLATGAAAMLLSALSIFLSGGAIEAHFAIFVLLGLLLGGMMCVDLGGPINKAAYAFSVGLLASQSYAPMAATMAAGMVPPIGLGIATFIARRKFAQTEREAGKAALVLGLCFISEGAIPFAAKDPLRVIPASVVGGALTGALSMYFGCKLMAPHGGLFVLLIPGAITPVVGYLLAIVAGTLVAGLSYAVLKRPRSEERRCRERVSSPV